MCCTSVCHRMPLCLIFIFFFSSQVEVSQHPPELSCILNIQTEKKHLESAYFVNLSAQEIGLASKSSASSFHRGYVSFRDSQSKVKSWGCPRTHSMLDSIAKRCEAAAAPHPQLQTAARLKPFLRGSLWFSTDHPTSPVQVQNPFFLCIP